MLVFSQSSWVSSALTDSSPSPLVLSLLTTSHLLAPAGSITISLGWLLLLLLAPWWNWKGWFSSSSCVCPLGRSWMLGHQLGCCRDFVEPETSPPPTHLHSIPSSSSSSPFLWSDVIGLERVIVIAKVTVCTVSHTDGTQSKVRGQRSANTSSMRPLSYEVN